MLINLKDKVKSIGLMSGTSLDGIDVCLASHENNKHELISFRSYPYSESLKQKILKQSKNETSCVQQICSLNKELGMAYVDAINQFLKDTNTSIDDVAFISNHGQTIWHNPESIDGTFPSTLQLGDASYISYTFNKTVVYDFRSLDVSAGGSGAPLVPVIDYLLFKEKAPAILLNIGGISNITYIPKSKEIGDVVAFDTGPGNMLIDGLMNKLYSMPFDKDAKVALNGNVSNELLSDLLNDEYYELPYPKSTGREKYNEAYLDMILEKAKKLNLKNEDIIKTITVLTAEVIKYQIDKFFKDFDGELIAAGGGCNNPVIMKYLQSDKYTLKKIDDYNISADAKEAFAFAILGYLRLTNQPSNLRKVTGSMSDLSLGSIILPPVIK